VADLRGRTLALLVGGPTTNHAFTDADWNALHSLLRDGAAAGVRWQVTSSRRTPDAVADRLAETSAALSSKVEFIDYRLANPGSIDPLFNADAILVTEDSNTMISEAVAARRPVIVLRPERVEEEMSSLKLLNEEGRLGIVPLGAATLDRVTAEISAVQPLERNPMDVLYDCLSEAAIVPRID
jgi:mitochondrial fission protein ELM1